MYAGAPGQPINSFVPKQPIEVTEEKTINPWMLYHVYSVYHTPQIGIRILKLSIMLTTL